MFIFVAKLHGMMTSQLYLPSPVKPLAHVQVNSPGAVSAHFALRWHGLFSAEHELFAKHWPLVAFT